MWKGTSIPSIPRQRPSADTARSWRWTLSRGQSDIRQCGQHPSRPGASCPQSIILRTYLCLHLQAIYSVLVRAIHAPSLSCDAQDAFHPLLDPHLSIQPLLRGSSSAVTCSDLKSLGPPTKQLRSPLPTPGSFKIIIEGCSLCRRRLDLIDQHGLDELAAEAPPVELHLSPLHLGFRPAMGLRDRHDAATSR